ncbi:hypothetical protein BRD56_04685 [Thermoplasmatales archaeon SW_10_69_26]|nr:MAG: hypothetical protein BRD56_04685 [Thermoplasmatales archaeon SW_10_69_26]
MEETVPCTIELPQGPRFDEAFALVEDELAHWLAEEGRIEVTFANTSEARTWAVKDVDVRIALQG